MSLMDMITMPCPTCGVILQIPPDLPGFGCWYCGTDYHLKENNMDVTLTNMAYHQVQGEISNLISSKEHKLDELAGCINAIIHRPEHALDKLLPERNRLEDDILELSLVIRLKQHELNRVRHMGCSTSPGD
jgi:hypothetical protein